MERDELGHVQRALDSVSACDLAPDEIVAGTIEKILAASPAGSRRHRFAALDRFLRWSLKGTGILPATAHFDVHERPRPPRPRRDFQRLSGLAQLWQAMDELPNPMTVYLGHFLLCIPARRSEAAQARWKDFDLKARIWRQPKSKNGDEHWFPLNDLAIGILHGRMGDARPSPDDLVFGGPRKGEEFEGWSNFKEAIVRRTGESVTNRR